MSRVLSGTADQVGIAEDSAGLEAAHKLNYQPNRARSQAGISPKMRAFLSELVEGGGKAALVHRSLATCWGIHLEWRNGLLPYFGADEDGPACAASEQTANGVITFGALLSPFGKRLSRKTGSVYQPYTLSQYSICEYLAISRLWGTYQLGPSTDLLLLHSRCQGQGANAERLKPFRRRCRLPVSMLATVKYIPGNLVEAG